MSVDDFIVNNIDSVGQFEVLILLQKTPTTHWTAEMVSQELRTNASSAASQLRELEKRGFLRAEGESAYYYFPLTTQLDSSVRSAIELYKERRIKVIDLIYNKPAERIKGLAGAFKLRKDD